ncbi:MAG: chaperone modulator CbpM [Wenzhouxiangellaceae bacterium]|nr:chaperone modulator CbpM [Wenzhouxiangellaceae bacterium]
MTNAGNDIEQLRLDEPEAVDLDELCAILELRSEVVCEWVEEGVVHPVGQRHSEWRFHSRELQRALRARRLQRDFELTTESLPLVLDLIGEVDRLRHRIRLLEHRFFE